MKRIIIHSTNFEKGNMPHYNLLFDKLFFDSLKSNYEIKFSNSTVINDNDVVLFFEAKSLVSNYFLFKHKNNINKLKNIIKLLFNKYQHKPLQLKKKKVLKILLILEGKLNAPENHSKNLSKYCDYILTWNKDLLKYDKFHHYNFTQQKKWTQPIDIPFENRKLLVNISANKYSSNENQLYEERRKIIRHAENKLSNEFDLYGFDWNRSVTFLQTLFNKLTPFYNSYKGEVKDKSLVFSKYKFAIIYENERVNGYVSEKIFDCLRSNCVPIYLGCPNINNVIPKNLFIDRSEFIDDENLINFIKNINKNEFNNYLLRIKKFINSNDFKKNFSSNLAVKISNLIPKN